MKIRLLILSIALLVLHSCIKDITDMGDVENVRITNLNGTYALPFVDSKVSIKDLVDDFDSLNIVRENSNGYLSIVYDDFAYTLDVNQYLIIPKINETVAIPISPAQNAGLAATPNGQTYKIFSDQKITQKLNLGDVELDKIDVLTALLTLKAADVPYDIEYTFRIPGITDNAGQVLSVTKLIPANSPNGTIVLNLNNKLWDLTEGGASFNSFTFFLTATVTKQSNTPITNFNIGVSSDDIRYKNVTGYLGKQNITDITTSLPITFFNENTTGGTFEVESPVIKLDIENDFQVPLNLSVTDPPGFVVKNKGADIKVTGINLPSLEPAPSPTEPSKKTYNAVNNIQPNIGTIVASNPNQIDFKVEATLNPNGKTATRNAIKFSDKIRIKTTFEMPLNGKAKNFRMTKEVPFKISDFENKDSMIDKVILKLSITNTFPLDVILQAQLLNPSTGASVKDLLPPNHTFVSGSIAGSTITEIELTGAEWETFSSMGVENVLLDAKFNTSGGGNVFQKITSSQFIDVKIGAKVFTKAKF